MSWKSQNKLIKYQNQENCIITRRRCYVPVTNSTINSTAQRENTYFFGEHLWGFRPPPAPGSHPPASVSDKRSSVLCSSLHAPDGCLPRVDGDQEPWKCSGTRGPDVGMGFAPPAQAPSLELLLWSLPAVGGQGSIVLPGDQREKGATQRWALTSRRRLVTRFSEKHPFSGGAFQLFLKHGSDSLISPILCCYPKLRLCVLEGSQALLQTVLQTLILTLQR